MEGPETTEAAPIAGELRLDTPDDALVVLSAPMRRVGLRIVPYGVVAEHPAYGALMFEPGAFGEVDPAAVRLRMDHDDPPTGIGRTFTDGADAARMEFQLSRTSRADDQLALLADGVSRGASVGYEEVPGRVRLARIAGREVRVYGPGSAVLREVSTTWRPTFAEAGVEYALAREETAMDESETQAQAGGIDYDRIGAAVAAALPTDRTAQIDAVLERFGELMELQRAQFAVPAAGRPRPQLHHWLEVTLRRMRGETVSPTLLRTLALDDVVTTEQPGLVPNAMLPLFEDLVSRDRPFLASTTRVEPPATGTSMILPVITAHATAGTQAGGEKTAVTTGATKVGTGTFAYRSVFGGADISLQMIQRAERSFFDLLTGDMAMAYAADCEAKAVAALLAGYTDSGATVRAPATGGTLDPEALALGAAWQTSITVCRRPPTHIWMGSDAVAAFIDARDPSTNAPLYGALAAAFTAGGGAGGVVSGLVPVYVPALDATAVDVVVGPARGFVWAEDPALTVQADVPSLAGRDIALVGGIFPAPRWADAFTAYTL